MEDFKKPKYTAVFTATAKVVAPSDEDRFVAKASLQPLKSLVPADVNPEFDTDLLYLVCNGAVAGLVNKNGDSISCATALAVYKTAKNKYISTDHDREKVVGVILYPGLSRFGTNEPLDEATAATLTEPFNMSFCGVLWKVINPTLSKYINNTGDETNPDSLSMSWEIAFNAYNIGVGSTNTFDATVIEPTDPSYGVYDKFLKGNGGSGKDASGKDVFRIITGDPVILGYSIVPNPAAEVKGILPLVNEPGPTEIPPTPAFDLSELPDSQRGSLEGEFGSTSEFDMCDITMTDGAIKENIPMLSRRYLPKSIDIKTIAFIKKCDKNVKKIITPINERVTINIAKTMKILNLEQIDSQWTEIRKLESAAAIVDFVKAIQEGSDKFVKEQEAKDALVKTSEAARLDAEKKNTEFAKSLASMEKKIEELHAKAESAEALQKFNDRMSELDAAFNLDDADRAVLASDVKSMPDDSVFSAYMGKCKVLMKDKTKKAPDAKTADTNDDGGGDDGGDDGDASSAKNKGGDGIDKQSNEPLTPKDEGEPEATDPAVWTHKKKASVDDKKAIASVTENKDEVIIKPTVSVDETMIQKMASAFGATLKIDGKSVDDRKSAKK